MILIFHLDDASLADMIEELAEEGNSATYVYESVVDEINNNTFSFAIVDNQALADLPTIHRGGRLDF